MTVKQWEAAESDKWIDSHRLQELSDVDKETITNFKIHFPQTKGVKYAGLIFPKDTHSVMAKICDPQVRMAANIQVDNIYAFPTRGKTLHVQGNYAIRQVAMGANVVNSNSIASSTNRHFVSSRYSALDVSEQAMEVFFQHMGHTKFTNIRNYRNPAGIDTILLVGKNLEKIEQGKFINFHITFYFIQAVLVFDTHMRT